MSTDSQQSSGRLGIPTSSLSDDNFGNTILRPGEGRIIKPTWDQKDNVYRILPGVDPDYKGPGEKLDYFRDGGNFGQWFWPITYVYRLGFRDTSKTFLMSDPQDRAYDISGNPVSLLRKAVMKVKRERLQGFNWAYLIEHDRATQEEPIPRPKDGFLVRCLVMVKGGKDMLPPMGFAPNSPMQYLLLSRATFDKVVTLFNAKREDYTGNNPADGYKYEDPTSFTHGLYVGINRPKGQTSTPGVNVFDVGGRQGYTPPGGQDGRDGNFESYEVQLVSRWGADISVHQHQIVPRLKKWRDVLHVPTHEEQVQYICGALGRQCPEVIVYALGEIFKSVIPDSIMREGTQRLAALQHTAAQAMTYGGGSFGPTFGAAPGGYAPMPPSYPTPPAGYGAPSGFAPSPAQQGYPPQAGYPQPPSGYAMPPVAATPGMPAQPAFQPQASPFGAPTAPSPSSPFSPPPQNGLSGGTWGATPTVAQPPVASVDPWSVMPTKDDPILLPGVGVPGHVAAPPELAGAGDLGAGASGGAPAATKFGVDEALAAMRNQMNPQGGPPVGR